MNRGNEEYKFTFSFIRRKHHAIISSKIGFDKQKAEFVISRLAPSFDHTAAGTYLIESMQLVADDKRKRRKQKLFNRTLLDRNLTSLLGT